MNDKFESGVKLDEGKNRYDLIDGYALDKLAEVYTYGTIKYEDNNWRKGMKFGRIFGALMRHSWAFWKGEELDDESGLPHMAHAAWCCFTLLNYSKYHNNFDDRCLEETEIELDVDLDLNEVVKSIADKFTFTNLSISIGEKEGDKK